MLAIDLVDEPLILLVIVSVANSVIRQRQTRDQEPQLPPTPQCIVQDHLKTLSIRERHEHTLESYLWIGREEEHVALDADQRQPLQNEPEPRRETSGSFCGGCGSVLGIARSFGNGQDVNSDERDGIEDVGTQAECISEERCLNVEQRFEDLNGKWQTVRADSD